MSMVMHHYGWLTRGQELAVAVSDVGFPGVREGTLFRSNFLERHPAQFPVGFTFVQDLPIVEKASVGDRDTAAAQTFMEVAFHECPLLVSTYFENGLEPFFR